MNKIPIILLNLILISFIVGCSNNKTEQSISGNEESFYQTPPISLSNTSNGILISLSDIPDDIKRIHVEIKNWGDNVYTYSDGDYPKHRDMIHSSNTLIEGEWLEKVKQTKEIIFPFVRTGDKYNISVTYEKPGMVCASTQYSQIIAENGIYLEKEITLILNENNTSVRLSDEPKFTSYVEYSISRSNFSFSLFNDEMSGTMGGISTGNNTKNISWDFEPSISEQIKRSRELKQPSEHETDGFKSGEYTALINYSINLIYDNIEWQNYFFKSPRFSYTIF